MANSFAARWDDDPNEWLRLSNGATDVFFDVLTVAGSDLTGTPWEMNLVVAFANSHQVDRGGSGFALAELPWTEAWQQEKAFFVTLVDRATAGYGWERLGYEPPFIADQLREYRAILASFAPTDAELGPTKDDLDWRFASGWHTPPPPAELEQCDKHEIVRGSFGCRLCSAMRS